MAHPDALAALPPAHEPNWELVAQASDEHAFMVDSVELLKEAGVLAALIAGVVPGSPHDRHAAIRCGLVVRLSKLVADMLADTCLAAGRQQLALARQAMETAGALAYLANDEGPGHEAFVADSLVAEREMLAAIGERQKTDNSPPWPIEIRMARSIEQSAQAAGIDDLQALPGRGKIGWPSPRRLLESMGPTAYVAYRASSGQVHGGWHDLYRNHLRVTAEGFEPLLDSPAPRPQPLLSTGILVVQAMTAYLRRRPPGEEEFFAERLPDLGARLLRLDAAHEMWLQRRAE